MAGPGSSRNRSNPLSTGGGMKETGITTPWGAHARSISLPPVCHLSFYEAWAFAQWADARLPSEAEWELAAGQRPVSGHFGDRMQFHPEAASGHGEPPPAVRRCLGVDLFQLCALPGLQTCCRCYRRVQRQIHGQPDGTARWQLRHAGRSHPANLPQFFSTPGIAGNFPVFVWHGISE